MSGKRYKDEDGYYHLIRNIDGVEVDLLEGKKAIRCWSYDNGDYEWVDEDWYYHLMRLIDGVWVDLLEGKKAIGCHSYDDGDYSWVEQGGKRHEVRKELNNE